MTFFTLKDATGNELKVVAGKREIIDGPPQGMVNTILPGALFWITECGKRIWQRGENDYLLITPMGYEQVSKHEPKE